MKKTPRKPTEIILVHLFVNYFILILFYGFNCFVFKHIREIVQLISALQVFTFYHFKAYLLFISLIIIPLLFQE